MLSNLLHKHLDIIDDIDADANAEIEKIISAIDIKALMKDPHQELGAITEQINNLIINKYQPLANTEGLKLAKDLQKKDVEVDPSKDPTKNKDDSQ